MKKVGGEWYAGKHIDYWKEIDDTYVSTIQEKKDVHVVITSEKTLKQLKVRTRAIVKAALAEERDPTILTATIL